MATQNIYDDPEFFENYSRLERSKEGLSGAAEWPSLQALLPDLVGRRIVDLGCGYGWFCRWAREHGAKRVLGLDVSERMLARAAEMTSDPGITYRRADLERLDLGDQQFDFAYSSLALHYIGNLSGLLAEIHRALAPGSRFVFSVEHPIVTAPEKAGWSLGPDGRRTWPVDSYQKEGPRRTNWLADGVIKQHRTLGTTLNLLIRLGFAIAHVEEWAPSDAQIAARPEWAEERERPMFLLVAVQR
ncbi:class I SAM-dependent methyltransferase [Microvirga sp. 3-52]|jgi:SAM-dependent methyltransferase|uniref:class I SAM-dependent methyltransferase n=1 Tax=Microvirga sp. 3-52 TaxID=2792425 RepID=UPI001AC69D14|nr:class I SAM-dependent methyltransferase [Microvirga sp. 3-52]MBO1908379.1 class I SAM-dependent methyltransferase [Microvirga sp. 3-52]MBS7454942.1 class I SAM-dependent methyltransferase [Microvirga sp. 3-52]